jgi:hypothetical protein
MDVVFVIDATESMAPFIDEVKGRVRAFENDLRSEMEQQSKGIKALRARLVAFRDINDDPATSFEVTRFFSLPDEQSDFAGAFERLETFGGADEPESGLEALYLAMQSPWVREPRDLKRRHIIMVFTDADAHELGAATIPRNFTQGVGPKSMTDLRRYWDGRRASGSTGREMDDGAKRLVLFAPDQIAGVETRWSQLAEDWEHTLQMITPAGYGMRDTDWEKIIRTLVATSG